MTSSTTIASSVAKGDVESVLEQVVGVDALSNAPPPIRILLLVADPDWVRAIERPLPRLYGGDCHIDHSASLEEAREQLAGSRFDAIILDLALQANDRLETFEAVRQLAGEIPILAVTDRDELGKEAVRRGAVDCLVKTGFDVRVLAQALRKSRHPPDRPQAASGPRSFDPVSPSDPTGFVGPRLPARRRHARSPLSRFAVVIPIGEGGVPDPDRQVDAVTVDISRSGIGFETRSAPFQSFERVVIGVEDGDGSLHYAVGMINSVRREKQAVRYWIAFNESAQDPLRAENLSPRFDVKKMTFSTPLDETILQQWASLGVATPEIVDQVDACPQCSAVASFRTGCRRCGSARLIRQELLHHFACAHVGFAARFEGPGNQLRCPKCRKKQLRVGTDVEYIPGPYQCCHCGSSDPQAERVGECLHCRFRFPSARRSRSTWLNTMFTDWIHWLSSRRLDELLMVLAPILLFDAPRYALGNCCVCLWESGQDLVRAVWRPGADATYAHCPTVCVIIAALNESDTIVRTLHSIWDTYPNLQIIVVDDGSTDETADKARQFAAARAGMLVLRNPRRGGKSSALNFALGLIKAEIVVCVDSDSVLAPSAIWEIVQPFADPRVGAVSATVLARNPFATLVTQLQAYEYLRNIFCGRRFEARTGILTIISGAFGAFRREVLNRTGGWDVGPGEDGDLTVQIRKLDYDVAFAPYAQCFTNVPTTWSRLFKQRRRWLWAPVTLSRKHRDMYNPFSANFRMRHLLVAVDRILYTVLLPYAILVCGLWWGLFLDRDQSWMLLTIYACYLALEGLQFLVILGHSTARRRDLCIGAVLPLMPLYGLVLKAVNLVAVTEELLLRRSRNDPFVPEHVRSVAHQS